MITPNMPKISVILPVYNGEKHLKDCIDSVLSQSFDDFELIIGDDNSKDNSCDIILSFNDHRIHVILRSQNLGLFDNLNDLVKNANAPIIRLLGQDDNLMSGCLENEVQFFRRHSQIGMSYCKAKYIDAANFNIGQSPIFDLPEILEPNVALKLFFFLGCLPGNISTVCFRKSHFIEVGGFDKNYGVAADYEAWTRLSEKYPLGIIHQYLIDLRLHNNQLSHASNSIIENIKYSHEIRMTLKTTLPKRLQLRAILYIIFRFNVQDIHIGIRGLFKRDISTFFKVISIMGSFRSLIALFFWIITLNNKLWRPSNKDLLTFTD